MSKYNNLVIGQTVAYCGKGFLGFHGDDTEMIFVKQESFNSVYVLYRGERMIVSPHEIKEIK